MIVWQGLGFLVMLIPIIFLGVIGATADMHHMTYSIETALMLSAITLWFLGKKLNGAPGKILIDPETNEEVVFKNKHTFFWIPMEWFAIAMAITVIFLVSIHFT
ncbi:MAG: hypothetical protein COB34_08570 [Methylophilaceae bacterium]|nr:MAG: hypothetical protein COB34_08570 [Methylophilaceae bacterium]